MCESVVHVSSDISPFSSVHNAFWEKKCPLSIRERERGRGLDGREKRGMYMAQHVHLGTCCIPFTFGGFQKKNLLPMGDEVRPVGRQ